MIREDIQKKLDELGIVSIEAPGDLSTALIEDTISSTEKLLNSIDLQELAKDINKAEEVLN